MAHAAFPVIEQDIRVSDLAAATVAVVLARLRVFCCWGAEKCTGDVFRRGVNAGRKRMYRRPTLPSTLFSRHDFTPPLHLNYTIDSCFLPLAKAIANLTKLGQVRSFHWNHTKIWRLSGETSLAYSLFSPGSSGKRAAITKFAIALSPLPILLDLVLSYLILSAIIAPQNGPQGFCLRFV